MAPRNTGPGAPLEDIAMLSMEFGRLLLECGASAKIVEETVETVARGLGAERVDLRIGYASLAVTVGIADHSYFYQQCPDLAYFSIILQNRNLTHIKSVRITSSLY